MASRSGGRGSAGRRQEVVKAVRNSLGALSDVAFEVKTHRVAEQPQPGDWRAEMSDLVFVVLTGAFFALVSLIVKGVERL